MENTREMDEDRRTIRGQAKALVAPSLPLWMRLPDTPDDEVMHQASPSPMDDTNS